MSEKIWGFFRSIVKCLVIDNKQYINCLTWHYFLLNTWQWLIHDDLGWSAKGPSNSQILVFVSASQMFSHIPTEKMAQSAPERKNSRDTTDTEFIVTQI